MLFIQNTVAEDVAKGRRYQRKKGIRMQREEFIGSSFYKNSYRFLFCNDIFINYILVFYNTFPSSLFTEWVLKFAFLMHKTRERLLAAEMGYKL